MKDNFNAVNAKIGVLKKGILKKNDYENILSFTKREEMIDYLKDNPLYKDNIGYYEEKNLKNRYMTEFMIHKTETQALNKLKYFLFGNEKEVLSAMLLRYEFEDIKIILRSIVEKEPLDIKTETIMYGISNHVDYDELSKCDSIHSALDILKNTIFRKAIVSLKDEDVLRLHFHVEMNLDSLYFSLMQKATKKLSKTSSNILNNYYSSITDTMNLQWIIRAKKFYNLSNEEIYNYCLRSGKYIKGELLKSLVYSETVEEVIEKIRNTKLKKMVDSSDSDLISYRDMQAYIFDTQLKKLKNYENTISTFLKFIILLLIQNENLTRIAEAKKYNLTKEEIKKYLIKTY